MSQHRLHPEQCATQCRIDGKHTWWTDCRKNHTPAQTDTEIAAADMADAKPPFPRDAHWQDVIERRIYQFREFTWRWEEASGVTESIAKYLMPVIRQELDAYNAEVRAAERRRTLEEVIDLLCRSASPDTEGGNDVRYGARLVQTLLEKEEKR